METWSWDDVVDRLPEVGVKIPNSRAERIIAEVCARHDVTVDSLKSSSRKSWLVKARSEAAWRLRSETDLSFPAIALHMGGKDHSSVIHWIKLYEASINVPVKDKRKSPEGYAFTHRKGYVDQVRALAELGKSAREVGAELGMTRSAVLGLAFRNKIKFHGTNAGERKATEGMREQIKAWIATHPFGSRKECAKALGFHRVTVNKYAIEIRAEWLNKGERNDLPAE